MDKSILLQVGVKVFLKNEEGRYLLLKRSPIRYPEVKNFWDIPGGRIFPGTPLFENIKREVFEESKLSVLGEVKLLGAQDIIRLPEKHIVRLTFSAETSGQPKLAEEDIEFKWVTLEEMKNLKELDEFTREILEKELIK
ncbi:MAG: NUDIX hydrolase [bacterium]|nr:NUDIX hydrolase [bacterium]